MPFQPFSGFLFFSRIWWKWKVGTIYWDDLRNQLHLVLFTASTVQRRPDRLNSIMAVWCVETPEVQANSSVYTPESLSQTKTNTFIGFQDLVCCDCPVAFEVSHRFMLFTYSCSFSQITMGYSVRIILAQCETMYELSIRCVNCTRHTSRIQ